MQATSSDASSAAAATATTTATPAAPPPPRAAKNVHRLTRIFRKPRTTIVARPWHRDGAADGNNSNAAAGARGAAAGVPAALLQRLLHSLSEEDKQRARAGVAPPTPTQEALARRAARFGIALTPTQTTATTGAQQTPAVVTVVDADTLRRRAERFMTQEQRDAEAAMQRRAARFGTAATADMNSGTATATAPHMSEADRAAMEARARRFGSA